MKRSLALILLALFSLSCRRAEAPAGGPRLVITPHRVLPLEADGRDVVFTPDSRIVATSSVDGAVRLWQVADGKPVATMQHPRGIASMAISADGRWIATGGYDRTVRLWSVAERKLVRVLEGHGGTVWAVAFSPDGTRLATGGEDKLLRVFRVSDGTLLNTLSGHTLNIWAVAFSNDGKWLASGSFDHTVRVWDATTGALKHELRGHDEAVVGIDISADSSMLASSGDDSTVRLWRLADGAPMRTLDAGNHVYSVSFTPDGQWVAGAGRERGGLGTLWKSATANRLGGRRRGTTLRVWRVADGLLQQELKWHRDDVFRVQFSPDGQWLATSSDDHTVRLWRATVRR